MVDEVLPCAPYHHSSSPVRASNALTTTAARRMVYPITHQHSLPPFAIGASSFVADGVQTGSKNRLIVVVVSASYSSHIPPQNRRRRPAMVESLFVYPIRIRLLRLSGVIVYHIG